VVFIAKRLATLVACVALVCGLDPAGLHGDLAASRGRDALTFDRTAPAPAELAARRVSPRLLASARQFHGHGFHPAVAAARAAGADAARSSDVARRPTCVAPLLVVCAHADRGPPHNVLS
jgi:hypothetical protein